MSRFSKLGAAGLLFLLACAWPGTRVEQSRSLPLWADPSRPRQERLASCVSCHGDAHAGWKGDRHSHSQVDLHAAQVFFAPPGVPDPLGLRKADYRKCTPCHVPRDLFESDLPTGLWSDMRSRIGDLRSDPEPGKTGVDCMTCHFQAKSHRVVTRSDYQPSDRPKPPGFCDPIASKFFSSDGLCTSCHRMNPSSHSGSLANTSCVSCHGQKSGPDGGFTHHFYGIHDDLKTMVGRPPRLDFLRGIKAEVRGSGKERVLVIEWTNDFAPHGLIAGPQQITVKVEVLSPSGQVRQSRVVRFTHPDYIDPAKKLDQEFAHAFIFDGGEGEHFVDQTPVSDSVEARGTLRLTVLHKDKYWADDSSGSKLAERILPYPADPR